MKKTYLLLFATTHDVIKAERSCLKKGMLVQVVPVPRAISSECGMALEVTGAANRKNVTEMLEESGILVKRVLEKE